MPSSAWRVAIVRFRGCHGAVGVVVPVLFPAVRCCVECDFLRGRVGLCVTGRVASVVLFVGGWPLCVVGVRMASGCFKKGGRVASVFFLSHFFLTHYSRVEGR